MVNRRASAAAHAADSFGYRSKHPNCTLRRIGFPVMSFSHQRYTHTAAPLLRSSSLRLPCFLSVERLPDRDPAAAGTGEDIPLLVNYFVSKLSPRMGKHIKSIVGLAS